MHRYKINKVFNEKDVESFVVVDNNDNSPVSRMFANKTQALTAMAELINNENKPEPKKKVVKKAASVVAKKPEFDKVAISSEFTDGVWYILKVPYNSEGKVGEVEKVRVGPNVIIAQERFKIVSAESLSVFLQDF